MIPLNRLVPSQANVRKTGGTAGIDELAASIKAHGLLQNLPAWNRHPDTIRRILTQAHVEAADRRARFVGIEAYTAAGGQVLRDLFTPEHDGYLTDPVLLDRLAAERLEREAEAIRAEGWKWVEIMPELDYPGLRQCRRLYPETQPPDETQQAEIDRLTTAYDALVAAHGDDPSDAVAAEIATIGDKIEALSQGTERWASEDLARAGAVIGIGHAGRIAVERGLVRSEDIPQAAAQTASRKDRNGRSKSGGGAGGELPAALTETLTAQRTAALRAMLAGDPDTALAAIVHATALPVFYRPFAAESCLALRLDSADLSAAEGIAESRAMTSLTERLGLWRQRLPEMAEGLWDWLFAQDTATRLDLLACCTALSVDAVERAHERGRDGRLQHADRLAAALGLDMAEWWQPTAESYLGRVSKARILAAVAEGVTPQAAENLAKLKKDALIAHAEERLVGKRWLPTLLRAPVVTQAEPQPNALAAE